MRLTTISDNKALQPFFLIKQNNSKSIPIAKKVISDSGQFCVNQNGSGCYETVDLPLSLSMYRVIKSEYLSYQISPGITKQHQCKVLVDAVYSSVRHQSEQATDVGEHPQDANVDILSTVLHISYNNNV